jgi:isopentenyl-diphosphate delta-isomerase
MEQNQKAEYITIVDKNGKYLGKEEREKCHRGVGILHSAFLVMIFNEKHELMLAKRSKRKSLWPDFWDGTVASHYHSQKNQETTVKKRIYDEIGIDCDHVEFQFNFYYQAKYKDIGTEHEICDVFEARNIKRADVSPNKLEISEFKFIDMPKLKKELQENSKMYAPWLLIALEKFHRLQNERKAYHPKWKE